jgi:glycosyltransferase involved in cell wall biosynthesis
MYAGFTNANNCDLAYSPKRKNILMVTEALARGGAERQMVALTHGLLRQGYDVQVFELIGVVAGQPSFLEELAQMGVRIRTPNEFSSFAGKDFDSTALAGLQSFAPLLPANSASLCHALQLVIQEFRPSVVNSWSDLSNLLGGVVSGMMRVPRIVLGQRVSIPPFWFNAYKAALYRQAYRVLAENPSVVFVNNSSRSAKQYESWLQLATGTIKTVHNGFLPSSVEIRKRSDMAACRLNLELPTNVAVVGAVMRFAPEKDPELWLETAAAIASERPDVHFLLAGSGHGAIADQLLKKGAELRLRTRLVMPGVVTDVGQVYGALDVLLLTSRTENLPNVMLEAQAAGIPVVGPDVGGICEAMLDGVTGVVVPDRSPQALAAAVLRILDDARWPERAAAKGPIFVARKFDQERMVRKMIAIYRP